MNAIRSQKGLHSFWALALLLVSAPLALPAEGPTSGSAPVECTVVCKAVVPLTADTGMTVQLSALAQTAGCTGDLTYQWDFGDGTPSSSEQNPFHVYPNPGQYTWKVTADVGSTGWSEGGTISVSAHQPPQGTTWGRHIGNTGFTERNPGRMRITADGGHILGCITYPDGSNIPEFWFLKTDPYGAITGTTTFPTAGYEEATDLRQTPDGGAIVSLVSESFSRAGGADGWLLKFDALGNCVWQNAYGTAAYDKIRSVVPTAEGGYAAVGTTTDPSSGDYNLWVLKLDATGAVTWQYSYGGSQGDFGYSIDQTADGGYIVAGETLSFGAGEKDIWVLKLDAAGAITWQSTYGGQRMEFAPVVREIFPGGGYFVAATTESSGAGHYDGLLLKLQSNGFPFASTSAGGFGWDEFHAMEVTPDGGAIIAGYTDLQAQGGGYGWLLRVDPAGDSGVPPLWQRAVGVSGYDDFYGVAAAGDGGFTASGNTTEFGVAVLLLHVDSNGNMDESCPLWIPAITWQPAGGWGSPTTVTPVAVGAVATGTQVQGTDYFAVDAILCREACEVTCTATVPATGFVWSATRFDVDVTTTLCYGEPTFFWTFGDGSTATGNKGTHAYHAAGTYDWAVEVMADGVMCVQTGTIVITESPCTVECVATVPPTGFVGSATYFKAEVTLTGCTEEPTYLWDLGNGTTVPYRHFYYGYLAPGTYNWYVMVTVQGFTAIRAGTITITESPCTVQCSASVPETGFVGSATTFSAEATLAGCTEPATFLWHFGDGSSATDQSATHAYPSPGTYNWYVEVTTQGFSCIKAGTIVITEPLCTVGCTASVPLTAVALTPFSFAGEATLTNCVGAPTFFWTFGDGGTASVNSGTHTYAAPGTYDWGLEVMADSVMCVRTGTVTVGAGLPGDGDGNGVVSIGEVQQSINMFLGIQEPGNGADGNGDGVISIGEVQKVINAFLGLAGY